MRLLSTICSNKGQVLKLRSFPIGVLFVVNVSRTQQSLVLASIHLTNGTCQSIIPGGRIPYYLGQMLTAMKLIVGRTGVYFLNIISVLIWKIGTLAVPVRWNQFYSISSLSIEAQEKHSSKYSWSLFST